MTFGRSRKPVAFVLVALVPWLIACPLPIARTEATSAPIVGTIVRADGTPASGLEMAVATESGDRRCTSPALRAHASATGMFRFPGTEKHYKTTWFVPNLDRAPPRFHLCAAVGDTMLPAYIGVGSLFESPEPDSVACVLWEYESSPRVSCVGRAAQAVVTGGSWTDAARGSVTGFYRLFLTEESTRVKGYDRDKPQDRPYVYVQWVEPRFTDPSGGSSSYRVHATLSLPFDRNEVWHLQKIRLWRREGRWMASLEGFRKAFMDDMARAELVFELGPPGKATKVAGP